MTEDDRITCDVCDGVFIIGATPADRQRNAAGAGWRFSDKGDLCPTCVAKYTI